MTEDHLFPVFDTAVVTGFFLSMFLLGVSNQDTFVSVFATIGSVGFPVFAQRTTMEVFTDG